MKPKNAAAATLLGPKKLQMMSQCEITRQGLSDARLRIFELLGGMYSTCFWFMIYIPPINNKLGPTNMAAMASKTIGSSIQSSFEISGNTETTDKIIGQSNISKNKLRVVGNFQKRMNLAEVALRSNSNSRSSSTRSIDWRKRFSPGMTSFADRRPSTISWKKKLAKGNKEIPPRILFFIINCDHFVSYSAIMNCVILHYFNVTV